MRMSTKHMMLASKLLHMAAGEFGNHGCNDPDLEWYAGWTDEEKVEFVNAYWQYNGTPEEATDDPADIQFIGDFAVMGFLAMALGVTASGMKENPCA